MNRLQESGLPQRKRQKVSEPVLTDEERLLFNLIRSRGNIGIWTGDMKRETNLPTTVVNKSLKTLIAKNMIKEVTTIQNKGRKHYMAKEFMPSEEITGGHFYSDGELDVVYINSLKDACLKCIFMQKVSTCDGCVEWIKRSSGVFNTEVTTKQMEEILQTLVLDDEITQMISTGYGEFSSITVGKTCYISKSKGGVRGEKKTADMTSFPCFSCQRMSFCSLDGTISPATCVYYQKWLDFLNEWITSLFFYDSPSFDSHTTPMVFFFPSLFNLFAQISKLSSLSVNENHSHLVNCFAYAHSTCR